MIAEIPKLPRTMMEAVRHFSDLAVCEQYVADIKWPNGQPCCPKCGSVSVGTIKSRGRYQCREKGCRKQFSVKTDTVMTDSPLPLDKWLIAAWMIVNCKNGVSSCEIARALGIKQQSAWHLLHRVRYIVKPAAGRQLHGVVEADTTFVGGRMRFMHADKRVKAREKGVFGGKSVVTAFLERSSKNAPGEVRAMIVKQESAGQIRRRLLDNVKEGTHVYTDAGAAYRWLQDSWYDHRYVNHMFEYARGSVHVNGLENFFSCLRRTIHGSYVAVDPQHLSAYVDEQAYRFNHRQESDWQRFDRAMHRIVGKRLEYKELTGGKTR